MVSVKEKTTKEWYDTYIKQNGKLTREQEYEFFGASVCCGYGLYGYRFEIEDGEYICHYRRGKSCD